MASGEIEVTRDGAVRWSTEGLPTARVYVAVDGGQPVLFAEHPFGVDRPDFLVAGHVYDWTLATLEGEVLDRARLDLREVQQPSEDRIPDPVARRTIVNGPARTMDWPAGVPGGIEQFLARPDAWLWIGAGALALLWALRRSGGR